MVVGDRYGVGKNPPQALAQGSPGLHDLPSTPQLRVPLSKLRTLGKVPRVCLSLGKEMKMLTVTARTVKLPFTEH